MKILTFCCYANHIPAGEIELLKIFISSAVQNGAKFEDINCIVDATSAHLLENIGINLIQREINHSDLLLERVRANRDFIDSLPDKTNLLICDYDIIFTREFRPPGSADFFVTVRPYAKYPINGGVLFFLPLSDKSRSLYRKVQECYEEIESPEDRRWWGDQISLSKVISDERIYRNFETIIVDNSSVSPLHADEFNWTPFDGKVDKTTLLDNFFISKKLLDEINGHTLVHFKGPRKHLMAQYGLFKSYSSSRNLSALDDLLRVNDEIASGNYLESLVKLDLTAWGLSDSLIRLLSLSQNKMSTRQREAFNRVLKVTVAETRDFRWKIILNQEYGVETLT